MAEALAKKMFPDRTIEFISAGTHPAKEVDADTIEILKEENIEWKGHPKSFAEIDRPDIIVTMGCDVTCPAIPGVRTIAWDIADPKGKGVMAYRNVMRVIEANLFSLINEITDRK